MKKNAFTLIEVMVVMAIISILAGMMVPAVWRFWESEEISTTRQRMKDLKIAMVGDRSLVQNGVRTHYGFVGDFGTLPFSNSTSCAFNYLNSSSGMTLPAFNPDNWSGRYLPSSSDSNSYAVDAWGKPIQCANKSFKDGRFVAVNLTSVAPSGEVLQEIITENEVTPTDVVSGNIFSRHSSVSKGRIKIKFTPGKTDAFSVMSTTITNIDGSLYDYTFPHKLPIGRANVDLVYRNDAVEVKNSFSFFVQDNQQILKMPDLNIP